MSSAMLKNNGGISKPFTPHATAKVPTIKNQTSSFEIPILGFGSGTAWYGANEGERKTNLKNSVKMAVKCGVHHIDCSAPIFAPCVFCSCQSGPFAMCKKSK